LAHDIKDIVLTHSYMICALSICRFLSRTILKLRDKSAHVMPMQRLDIFSDEIQKTFSQKSPGTVFKPSNVLRLYGRKCTIFYLYVVKACWLSVSYSALWYHRIHYVTYYIVVHKPLRVASKACTLSMLLSLVYYLTLPSLPHIYSTMFTISLLKHLMPKKSAHTSCVTACLATKANQTHTWTESAFTLKVLHKQVIQGSYVSVKRFRRFRRQWFW
jgi:hypothetical protein